MEETLFQKIKTVTLRKDSNVFDGDIQETIDAGKADLELAGISKERITEGDALIIRALKLFCKAEYSTDEKETDRCRVAYEALRNHLALSIDYAAGEKNEHNTNE